MIRETEFSRGYFVGGLGWDNNNNNNVEADRKKVLQDAGEEEEEERGNGVNLGARGAGVTNRDQIVNIEKTKKTQLGNDPIKNIVDDSELSSTSVSSSSSPSSSSPASSSPVSLPAWKGEWYGDRIEILVGSGDVYLQFEDENEDDDPFYRTRNSKKEVGFWKKFFFYPSFF